MIHHIVNNGLDGRDKRAGRSESGEGAKKDKEMDHRYKDLLSTNKDSFKIYMFPLKMFNLKTTTEVYL